MSEEGAVENEGTQVPGEVSPAEQKARSQGWVSEDEWVEAGKDADDWVDAKQFVFRGELMSRIQQQSKQLHESNGKIDQLNKALKKMGEINSKIAEEQYQKAIKTLKKQKAAAMGDEDHDAVVEIEDQIEELKEAQKAMKEEAVEETGKPEGNTGAVPQEFYAWVEENQWYNTDPLMRGAADALGMAYAQAHPELPPQAVLDHVSKQIKIEMPHKFGGGRPGAPAVLEGGGRQPGTKGKKSKFTAKDLDSDQLKMAKTFVDSGALPDIQTYVDQLVEIGELGS